ncbi:ankyrin repeat domain-containing protein [Candidatus Babela massiliensis]|uniref:Ankyrin repeat protein n=1 Tax=Candidatus Babela massiliensis TaxID=673862 RepID=V6DGK6_9BACT
MLKCLLNARADPNILGFNKQTPLLDAISRDNTQSINILLKYGADINISNQYGINPLSLANSPANKKF